MSRPILEQLELRETPAIFTVTNVGDAGFGSLRQAINDVNASNDTGNNINFNIVSVGPFTISSSTGYPSINKPVTIDGYSQPAATRNTLAVEVGNDASLQIILDGQAGAGTGFQFAVGAAGSFVQGISFVNFNNQAIALADTKDFAIQGNYFGLLPNGTLQNSQTKSGVFIKGGNLVLIGDLGDPGDPGNPGNPGNQNLFLKLKSAIDIASADQVQIQRNRIGVGRDNTSFGANNTGIDLNASDANGSVINVKILSNVIGKNIDGIGISTTGDATVTNIDILSNFIGTDKPDGTINLGNSGSGILVKGKSSSIFIGGDPAAIPGPKNNNISFNTFGISLDGADVNNVGVGANSIRNNINPAISLQNGANSGIKPAVIVQQSETTGTTGKFFKFDATISGGLPNTEYTVQFYSSLIGDTQGGGANSLGATQVRTNDNGAATISNFAPVFNTTLVGKDFVVTSLLSRGTGQAGTGQAGTSAFSGGPPAILNLVLGNNQAATVVQNFPAPLAVEVRDSRGDPVPGLGILYQVLANAAGPGAGAVFFGQSLSATITSSGNNASIYSPPLTANSTSGQFNVTASIVGNTVLNPPTFTLNNYLNPLVVSINRVGGATAATSAVFTVTFSESVTGVDPADFTTVKSGTVASGSITV
ncbi:MAG: hypothetical protein EXR99_11570, partial [Gemmataceae bacterium]|nr:hypothetical protein [Gemmataceae bacterium]